MAWPAAGDAAGACPPTRSSILADSGLAGAFWGGILVGVLESVGSQLIPITYAEALIFLLFLATMYFRPSGLFGVENE